LKSAKSFIQKIQIFHRIQKCKFYLGDKMHLKKAIPENLKFYGPPTPVIVSSDRRLQFFKKCFKYKKVLVLGHRDKIL
jgi:hypothetical protein